MSLVTVIELLSPREPLPVIGIPLDGQHDDARLDLQEILNHIYETAGYEFYIYRYELDPPAPPESAKWLEALVPARQQFE